MVRVGALGFVLLAAACRSPAPDPPKVIAHSEAIERLEKQLAELRRQVRSMDKVLELMHAPAKTRVRGIVSFISDDSVTIRLTTDPHRLAADVVHLRRGAVATVDLPVCEISEGVIVAAYDPDIDDVREGDEAYAVTRSAWSRDELFAALSDHELAKALLAHRRESARGGYASVVRVVGAWVIVDAGAVDGVEHRGYGVYRERQRIGSVEIRAVGALYAVGFARTGRGQGPILAGDAFKLAE